MRAEVPRLRAFASEIARDFRRVALLGMGGSSLAPLVFRDAFGAATRHPSLTVLDSTDPAAVTDVAAASTAQTLYLVSSKSGTTLETDCLFRYFWERQPAGEGGSRFVAITDPGTPLARLADERRFRRAFLNPPDIGGRYSALSYFALVPAALLGVDVARLLDRAQTMAQACAAEVPPTANPALRLGAALGEAALTGRAKVTLSLPREIATFGLWLEQLIAESTGKEGKGLVPITDEPLSSPDVYDADRLFIAFTVADQHDDAVTARLAALEAAGHPVVRIALTDRYDLGRELFRWPFAVAVAGAVLGINPFDQPDVAVAKNNTDAVLARGSAATDSPPATPAELERFLQDVEPADYLGLLVYLPPTPGNDRRLTALRQRLRERFRATVTVGYGPRYLHSTGQLHKGGPAGARFVVIAAPAAADAPIPGKPFTFGQLEAAQAAADLLALRERGRAVVRVNRLEELEATVSAG
jgi:glucose-6-phosphate isomerase